MNGHKDSPSIKSFSIIIVLDLYEYVCIVLITK